MPENARVVRPEFEIVYVGDSSRDPAEREWTGITTQVWNRRTVGHIVSTGLYLAKDVTVPWYETHLDWQVLWMWRLYIVRRVKSSRNSYEMVERHYLYKIHVPGTQRAWATARRIAGESGDNFDWRVNNGRGT